MILERPIIFFDVETTGTSVAKDKIVELYAKKLKPNTPLDEPTSTDYDIEELHFYFRPGVKVSEEVIAIHGLTNEFLEDKPTFQQKAGIIMEFFEGCDVGGYNVKRFDIPILVEEMLRCGINFNITGHVVDCYDIVVKQFPRNLSYIYKVYTGHDMEDAHQASADVDATINVFIAQTVKHRDEIGETVADIAEYCKGDLVYADYEQKLFINADGDICYSFGKAKGKRVIDDTGFGEWMLKNDFTLQTKAIVRNILNNFYGK